MSLGSSLAQSTSIFVSINNRDMRLIDFMREFPDEKEYCYYQNGKLYYSGGEEYTGNNQFVLSIAYTITQLYTLNDSYINEVLSTLEDSELNHYMAPGMWSHVCPQSEYGNSLANEGKPVESVVYISFDSSPKGGVSFTPEQIVAHELRHAYDFDQGYNKGIIPWESTLDINPAEIRAVNFENRVRVRMRMPMRKRYSSDIPASLLENPWKKKTDKK